MRKVIFAINMSIDGCVDHTRFFPNEDVFEYWNNFIHSVDLIAYGRKMYELMFPYWADPANCDSELEKDFAQRLTSLEKVIFSRTLKSADYNARVVSTDPVAELLKLKQAPGGDISASTVSMLPLLTQAGIIDEYRLVVHPIIVGCGVHLVDAGGLAEKLKLTLVSTKTFKSGAIALHYAKDE